MDVLEHVHAHAHAHAHANVDAHAQRPQKNVYVPHPPKKIHITQGFNFFFA